MRRARAKQIVILAALAACAACAEGTAGPQRSTLDAARLHVVASFYPLQFIVQRIGGDRVAVTNLTPVGAEPHDIELPTAATAAVQDADLVVYLRGFAPAVDSAVSKLASGDAVDVSGAAELRVAADGNGRVDPHFWLDPRRLGQVAAEVTSRLSARDPDGAAVYASGLVALRVDLGSLDADLRAGLQHCANRNIVTSHEAFGYLADRYGLRQVAVDGLTPDDEPSPRTLASISDFVRANDVTTIYVETLANPAVVEAIAAETRAATVVLDPIEGVAASPAGGDYLTIMRANLARLRSGQRCG